MIPCLYHYVEQSNIQSTILYYNCKFLEFNLLNG